MAWIVGEELDSMCGIAWSPAWTWSSGLGHAYRSGGSKDCDELNDIHSEVNRRHGKIVDGWGMMIMVGDGDDIYDGFVYIPWVIVSLGRPRVILYASLNT